MTGAVHWMDTRSLGRAGWEGEEERFSLALGCGTGDRSVHCL